MSAQFDIMLGTPNPDENVDESGDQRALVKFGFLLSLGLIVVYAKFLWPLVFGRMHNDGISLLAAILDVRLHAMAFGLLVTASIFAFLWARFREAKNG